MRTLIALLLMTSSAYAQTVSNINNANINVQGASQTITITQTGSGHSATVDLRGNNITFVGSQTGSTPQSYSFSVDCNTTCPSSPYYITQY